MAAAAAGRTLSAASSVAALMYAFASRRSADSAAVRACCSRSSHLASLLPTPSMPSASAPPTSHPSAPHPSAATGVALRVEQGVMLGGGSR